MNNIYLKKYYVAIAAAVALVALIAVFDIYSMNSGVFGTPEQYTNGQFLPGWGSVFHNIVLAGMILLALSYYLFYKQDKSESFAVFLTAHTLWIWGLADVLYFWFQGKAVPATLPWLNNHTYIGGVANTLCPKLSTFCTGGVTDFTLIISVLVGGAIVFVSAYILEKIN